MAAGEKDAGAVVSDAAAAVPGAGVTQASPAAGAGSSAGAVVTQPPAVPAVSGAGVIQASPAVPGVGVTQASPAVAGAGAGSQEARVTPPPVGAGGSGAPRLLQGSVAEPPPGSFHKMTGTSAGRFLPRSMPFVLRKATDVAESAVEAAAAITRLRNNAAQASAAAAAANSRRDAANQELISLRKELAEKKQAVGEVSKMYEVTKGWVMEAAAEAERQKQVAAKYRQAAADAFGRLVDLSSQLEEAGQALQKGQDEGLAAAEKRAEAAVAEAVAAAEKRAGEAVVAAEQRAVAAEQRALELQGKLDKLTKAFQCLNS